MSTRTIEDLYPLSAMQQGMLFHSLAAPGSGLYIEVFACTLHGPLDVARFQHAWQYVVDQQPLFRSATVDTELRHPYQVIFSEIAVDVWQQDWRDISPEEQALRFDRFIQDERETGLDLSEPPLFRLTLLRLDDETYRFVWTHHHMLLDGWSLPLVLQDVFSAYDDLAQGKLPSLPERRPYRDYIAWLQDQDQGEAEAFWRSQLRGFSAATPLIIDRPLKSVAEHSPSYGQQSASLSRETTQRLRDLARRHRLTLSTVVQGAWAILLSRYTSESDVLFGATVAGRPAELAGVEAMIGLFINTLPVRAQIDHEQPVSAWLEQFQQQSVALRQYEYAPLPEIQGWSEVPRGTPLFESLVIFENYPLNGALSDTLDELTISEIRVFEGTNYPLTLASAPAECLPLYLSYDTRRFDHDQIERMLGHLRTLLEGIATDPACPIAKLPLLTPAERQMMLVDWNQTAIDHPVDQPVHRHFEARVHSVANRVAWSYEDAELTYQEWNRRANRLAHYLQRQGVQPETFVGVYTQRSLDWVIAVLAIWKAGGVYVPVDPEYPAERVRYMFEDCRASIVLTQEHLAGDLSELDAEIFCLDRDQPLLQAESDANLDIPVRPDNLAYVIYTSGSTGLPKGVMVEHRSLTNGLFENIRILDITDETRELHTVSLSFDVSLIHFGLTLLAGAWVRIMNDTERKSGYAELQAIKELGITCGGMPRGVTSGLTVDDLPTLHTVIAGGERITREDVQRWGPGRRFLNSYGPTETTIIATVYDCDPEEQTDPPIGKPMGNYQTYVLDDHLQPLPIGVPGELHIGGIGVARGYLNRPDLTAERFIPDPFRTTPGARLYKTGDLVRYRADGNLEFLGRLDHQVKIRGYRIELGEIEARLRQHPAVRETVVLAREDTPGDKRLVAYLTTGEQLAPSVSELRGFLKQTLPDYMLPSHFVVLVTFPLTPNGKIDRQHLPPPTSERPELASAYVAPRTPQERQLAAIWQEVLGVEQVGIADNFFDLGGASLQTLEAASRAQEIGVPLTPELLFVYPTIAELSELAEGGN